MITVSLLNLLDMGDDRMLYHLDHDARMVSAASIGHRRDGYED